MCFCHKAMAASVAAPQIAYFAVGFKNGSLWSDHKIRAYRTSRHIAHAGPASPRLMFGLCVTCHHCLVPQIGNKNRESRASSDWQAEIFRIREILVDNVGPPLARSRPYVPVHPETVRWPVQAGGFFRDRFASQVYL